MQSKRRRLTHETFCVLQQHEEQTYVTMVTNRGCHGNEHTHAFDERATLFWSFASMLV